jgi:hypothetical protein
VIFEKKFSRLGVVQPWLPENIRLFRYATIPLFIYEVEGVYEYRVQILAGCLAEEGESAGGILFGV